MAAAALMVRRVAAKAPETMRPAPSAAARASGAVEPPRYMLSRLMIGGVPDLAERRPAPLLSFPAAPAAEALPLAGPTAGPLAQSTPAMAVTATAPAPTATASPTAAAAPAAAEAPAAAPMPAERRSVAGPVAGRALATGAGAGPERPEAVPVESPHQAMAPAISAIRHRAAAARRHPASPKIPVDAAQAAGTDPSVEATRDAACQTVQNVGAAAQQTEEAKRTEFKEALKKKVTKAADDNMQKPETKSQADDLIERGAKRASDTVGGELTTQRDAATAPLKSAASSEVLPAPGSGAAPELHPEQVGPPPAPVSAASVVPPPLPAERLDYSSDHAPTDQLMAENDVSEQQLKEGNDPAFGPTLEARATAKQHEASAEPRYRQSEAKERADALAPAQLALAQGLSAIHGVRESQVGEVVKQQHVTQSKNSIERTRITNEITRIKNKTLKAVEDILSGMEKEAVTIFEAGLAAAEKLYNDVFKEAKGGIGTWLTTWGSSWDKLIENSLAKAHDEYTRKVKETIDQVADFIYDRLAQAKHCVAAGLEEVKTFVHGLHDNVKQFGDEALKEVGKDFEAMVTGIDQRRDALVDKLTQQFAASYQRMSAMEEKLREENKSLWRRIYDATVGLVKKIIEFKNMLLNVLSRAASLIGDIIRHPIRFLENLVSAIGDGISNFVSNIETHLKRGLINWLVGGTDAAGLELPETLDLPGIIKIALQILHIDRAHFRARAVAIVGEPVVATLEQAAEVFNIVRTEGLSGLLRLLQQHLTDLKSTVLDAILDYIKNAVIKAGVGFILKLLNPASAFFAACKAIYEIVKFLIERGSQIVDLINAVIDSVAAIVKGDTADASRKVEGALAKAIPVAIGFLASLLDIGDPAATVRSIIEKARALVDRAIDAVINLAVKGVKAAGKFVSGIFGGKEAARDAVTGGGDKGAGAGDVRDQAKNAVSSELSAEHTEADVTRILAQIEARLRPMGLVSLVLGPPDADGSLPVLAEASPPRVTNRLIRALPGGEDVLENAPKDVHVRTLVTLTFGKSITIEPADIAVASELPGLKQTTGGLVLPQKSSQTLDLLTWNIGSEQAFSNLTHAEQQFVAWLEKNPEVAAAIESLVVTNYVDSPCPGCTATLSTMLRQIAETRGKPFTPKDRDALIIWARAYKETTWQTVVDLYGAGWWPVIAYQSFPQGLNQAGAHWQAHFGGPPGRKERDPKRMYGVLQESKEGKLVVAAQDKPK